MYAMMVIIVFSTILQYITVLQYTRVQARYAASRPHGVRPARSLGRWTDRDIMCLQCRV